MNSLPLVRRAKTARGLSRLDERDLEEAAMCMEALLHCLGTLEVWLAESARRLRNPLIWLREGVRFFLLLPVSVLRWLGFIGPSRLKRIENSGIVRVISGLVALVELLSGTVAICVGWDEFTNVVMQLWQALF
jgi:hypothetical protein